MSSTRPSTSPSSSEALISPSEALFSSPSPPMKVSSSVWTSPHGFVTPIVAVVRSSALRSGRGAHHAWPTGVKGRPVAVGRRRVVEMGPPGGLVRWEATVHGHLHVHVVHVHSRSMSEQTRVYYECRKQN